MIGYPFDVYNGVASIGYRFEDDLPTLQVPLRSLSLVYEPGDHVKHQWMKTHRIVELINEGSNMLSYMKTGSCQVVSGI